MSAELIPIHPKNPELRKIKRIIQIIKAGGILIYPTDTVYGIGCDLMNKKAVHELARIKKMKDKQFNLTFICLDISQISQYVRRIENSVHKILKKTLPGPFTYIFEANNRVPRLFESNKRTVGVRIPNHPITSMLVEQLGNPLVSASLKTTGEIAPYLTDPEEIYETFKNDVAVIIDGGVGGNVPSTVVDCTQNQICLIREGLGNPELIV